MNAPELGEVKIPDAPMYIEVCRHCGLEVGGMFDIYGKGKPLAGKGCPNCGKQTEWIDGDNTKWAEESIK